MSAALWRSNRTGRSRAISKRVDAVHGACRLTFMATNATGTDSDALTLGIVLIRTDGQVDRLTLFEFWDLPAGVPRVRQFDKSDLVRDDLDRVVVNGVADCRGGDWACDAPTTLMSHGAVGLLGRIGPSRHLSARIAHDQHIAFPAAPVHGAILGAARIFDCNPE